MYNKYTQRTKGSLHMAQPVNITYINHDNTGFADQVAVSEGTTIGQFFESKMPGKAPRNYLILVNGGHTASNRVLVDGDRVSITPTKVQGASACS